MLARTSMLIVPLIIVIAVGLAATSIHAGQSPAVDAVVQANDNFAFNLYTQLAKAPAANVFFSPYSMSVALTMTAEGARGQTAQQMGEALKFPDSARNTGPNAPDLPWNMKEIHEGMSSLVKTLAPKAVAPELRDRIASLQKQLAAANERAEQFRKKDDYRNANKAAMESRRLANELNALLPQVDQYELRIANALWAEKTYPFQKSYLDTIGKYYDTGGAFDVDFINAAEAVRKRINAWVEEQTHDRIKELLPPNSVNDYTRLVLTNAVYFKGEWADVFEASDTRPDDFTTSAGATIKAPMMRKMFRHGSAGYGAIKADGSIFATPERLLGEGAPATGPAYYPDNGFQMVELPYKGNDLSMVLIAPRNPDGIGALEKLLTAVNVQQWIKSIERRGTYVIMPKFKLETSYGMRDPLEAMGMTRAFADPTKPNGAQFDGMCASDDPNRKLYISAVLHKAFVEVNEKGTEAAAATAVIMAEAMAAPMRELPPFIPEFNANKPFVFLIRDVRTGTILFLGRVGNPA